MPLTEADRVGSLTLAAKIAPSRWISLSEAELAPDLTEFNQRVEGLADSSAAVSKMLRAAARRVTEQAPTELRVADGFVAFAIDWELEGHELSRILKQCGATAKRIRDWKRDGWL